MTVPSLGRLDTRTREQRARHYKILKIIKPARERRRNAAMDGVPEELRDARGLLFDANSSLYRLRKQTKE